MQHEVSDERVHTSGSTCTLVKEGRTLPVLVSVQAMCALESVHY